MRCGEWLDSLPGICEACKVTGWEMQHLVLVLVFTTSKILQIAEQTAKEGLAEA